MKPEKSPFVNVKSKVLFGLHHAITNANSKMSNKITNKSLLFNEFLTTSSVLFLIKTLISFIEFSNFLIK
jgi:hypothetical protein